MAKINKSVRGSKSLTKDKIVKNASHILTADTGNIGKYAKMPMTKGGLFGSNKPSQGLTRRQTYKLERENQKTRQMQISSGPEMVRAIGQAVGYNTVGAQAGLGSGIASKMSTPSSQTNNQQIGSLINGGANKATKDNAEEEAEESGTFSSFLR